MQLNAFRFCVGAIANTDSTKHFKHQEHKGTTHKAPTQEYATSKLEHWHEQGILYVGMVAVCIGLLSEQGVVRVGAGVGGALVHG